MTKIDPDRYTSPSKRWTDKETRLLESIVNKYDNKWEIIAQEFNSLTQKNKTYKQCRERYINNHSGITSKSLRQKEKARLFALVKVHGTNWTQIAQHFSGRSANTLKNVWHSHQRREEINFKNWSPTKISPRKISPRKISPKKCIENILYSPQQTVSFKPMNRKFQILLEVASNEFATIQKPRKRRALFNDDSDMY